MENIYILESIDPRGLPTVTACSDHYIHTCCSSVRPHFSISSEARQIYIVDWPSGSLITPVLCICI